MIIYTANAFQDQYELVLEKPDLSKPIGFYTSVVLMVGTLDTIEKQKRELERAIIALKLDRHSLHILPCLKPEPL